MRNESEEMYLVATALLAEQSDGEYVPLPQLAAALDVIPVSANQMVHKLARAGLVAYTAYKGVALTPAGRKAAERVLRARRLWEVFLATRLHLAADEAEQLACALEHDTTEELAARLAHFLGHPQLSPRGRTIPAAQPGEPAPLRPA